MEKWFEKTRFKKIGETVLFLAALMLLAGALNAVLSMSLQLSVECAAFVVIAAAVITLATSPKIKSAFGGLIRDLSELTVSGIQDPGTITASAAATNYIDLQGYEGTVAVAITVHPVSGTTPTFDCKLQDCDTSGGTYADITTNPTAVAITQVTTGATVTVILTVEPRATRRFIKPYMTLGGTTPNYTVAIVAVGMKQIV